MVELPAYDAVLVFCVRKVGDRALEVSGCVYVELLHVAAVRGA